jgi:hypothetical protein
MSRRGLDLGPSFAPELVKKYETAANTERPLQEAHQLVSRTEITTVRKAQPPAAEKQEDQTQKMDYAPSFGSLVSRSLLSTPRPASNVHNDLVAWQRSTDNDPQDPTDLEERMRKQRGSSPWQTVPMDANAISSALLNGQ